MTVLKFFLALLEQPAIVLGVVALIGLIAQKKSGSEVFSGTVKTALGYIVLSAGSGLIVQYILPFVNSLLFGSLIKHSA